MTDSFLGKFLKFWFPAVLYSGIIFYVSSLPNLKPPLELPFIDKLAHLLEYAILGVLVARAVRKTTPLSYGRILGVATLFCLCYGISDEFHQSFVPGRMVSLSDVIFDGFGGFIGSFICKK